MDYVTNGNVIIAKESRSDKAGTILAYDMYLAKNRNSGKRKEKAEHAFFSGISGVRSDEPSRGFIR